MVDFSMLPPEINSLSVLTGPGSGPMRAAALAWNGFAAELEEAATTFESITSGLTAQAWQGPAAQAMVAAAAPCTSWLTAAATQASGAATQAQVIAGAFESTSASIVDPALVSANRSGLVTLARSNLFGQNGPAIAQTESQYEEMWAQDVAVLTAYHSSVSAAAEQLILPAQAVPKMHT